MHRIARSLNRCKLKISLSLIIKMTRTIGQSRRSDTRCFACSTAGHRCPSRVAAWPRRALRWTPPNPAEHAPSRTQLEHLSTTSTQTFIITITTYQLPPSTVRFFRIMTYIIIFPLQNSFLKLEINSSNVFKFLRFSYFSRLVLTTMRIFELGNRYWYTFHVIRWFQILSLVLVATSEVGKCLSFIRYRFKNACIYFSFDFYV